MTHCTEDTVVSGVFVCISGSDGSERCGREMVNASTGCVYVRQVGSSCAYHHYRLCPALYRYVFEPCSCSICLQRLHSSLKFAMFFFSTDSTEIFVASRPVRFFVYYRHFVHYK